MRYSRKTMILMPLSCTCSIKGEVRQKGLKVIGEEALDIDNWSFEELKDVVQLFKSQSMPATSYSINSPTKRFGFDQQQPFDVYPDKAQGKLPSTRITVIESVDGEESIMLKAISSSFKLYQECNQTEKGPMSEVRVKSWVEHIQVSNKGFFKKFSDKVQLNIKTQLGA